MLVNVINQCTADTVITNKLKKKFIKLAVYYNVHVLFIDQYEDESDGICWRLSKKWNSCFFPATESNDQTEFYVFCIQQSRMENQYYCIDQVNNSHILWDARSLRTEMPYCIAVLLYYTNIHSFNEFQNILQDYYLGPFMRDVFIIYDWNITNGFFITHTTLSSEDELIDRSIIETNNEVSLIETSKGEYIISNFHEQSRYDSDSSNYFISVKKFGDTRYHYIEVLYTAETLPAMLKKMMTETTDIHIDITDRTDLEKLKVFQVTYDHFPYPLYDTPYSNTFRLKNNYEVEFMDVNDDVSVINFDDFVKPYIWVQKKMGEYTNINNTKDLYHTLDATQQKAYTFISDRSDLEKYANSLFAWLEELTKLNILYMEPIDTDTWQLYKHIDAGPEKDYIIILFIIVEDSAVFYLYTKNQKYVFNQDEMSSLLLYEITQLTYQVDDDEDDGQMDDHDDEQKKIKKTFDVLSEEEITAKTRLSFEEIPSSSKYNQFHSYPYQVFAECIKTYLNPTLEIIQDKIKIVPFTEQNRTAYKTYIQAKYEFYNYHQLELSKQYTIAIIFLKYDATTENYILYDALNNYVSHDYTYTKYWICVRPTVKDQKWKYLVFTHPGTKKKTAFLPSALFSYPFMAMLRHKYNLDPNLNYTLTKQNAFISANKLLKMKTTTTFSYVYNKRVDLSDNATTNFLLLGPLIQIIKESGKEQLPNQIDQDGNFNNNTDAHMITNFMKKLKYSYGILILQYDEFSQKYYMSKSMLQKYNNAFKMPTETLEVAEVYFVVFCINRNGLHYLELEDSIFRLQELVKFPGIMELIETFSDQNNFNHIFIDYSIAFIDQYNGAVVRKKRIQEDDSVDDIFPIEQVVQGNNEDGQTSTRRSRRKLENPENQEKETKTEQKRSRRKLENPENQEEETQTAQNNTRAPKRGSDAISKGDDDDDHEDEEQKKVKRGRNHVSRKNKKAGNGQIQTMRSRRSKL